jgi:hypothetical protein
MTSAEHKICKGEMINVNKTVVRKPERRGPFGIQDSIKIDFKR